MSSPFELADLELLLPMPENPSYWPSPAGDKTLEIGGGPHSRRLNYTQFDAIDWHDRTGLEYVIGDARDLPYFHGELDHIYASNLLEHFVDTQAILTEWTRVLRPGGILEIVVPDFMSILVDFFSGRNPWQECQERILGSDDYEGNQHHAAFTLSTFPQVIEQVPELDLVWCRSCHSGGGVWAVTVKKP